MVGVGCGGGNGETEMATSKYIIGSDERFNYESPPVGECVSCDLVLINSIFSRQSSVRCCGGGTAGGRHTVQMVANGCCWFTILFICKCKSY